MLFERPNSVKGEMTLQTVFALKIKIDLSLLKKIAVNKTYHAIYRKII